MKATLTSLTCAIDVMSMSSKTRLTSGGLTGVWKLTEIVGLGSLILLFGAGVRLTIWETRSKGAGRDSGRPSDANRTKWSLESSVALGILSATKLWGGPDITNFRSGAMAST